jgi:TM2 domain-containing membrane protein YozV
MTEPQSSSGSDQSSSGDGSTPSFEPPSYGTEPPSYASEQPPTYAPYNPEQPHTAPPQPDPYGAPPPPFDPYGTQPPPNYGPPPTYGAPADYGMPPPAGFPPPAAGYGPPPQYGGNNPYPQPGAPYGVDAYGRPLSDKSKLTAGLLQIFLGGFGVGRFYLGYTTIGVLQLVVTLVTCGLGSIWGLVDGILVLVDKVPDAQGRTLRD